MRRSRAPSIKKHDAKLTNRLTFGDNEVSSSNDLCLGSRSNTNGQVSSSVSSSSISQSSTDNFNKVIFNIVWREISNKKHKTWKGDGSLEVSSDGSKVVLKDESGKYMGSTTSFKLSELEEGLQMTINGKEIELQDKIHNIRDFYAKRKLQVTNRGWGQEELEFEEPTEKKPKASFVYRPIIPLLLSKEKGTKNAKPFRLSTREISMVEPLILPTPDDTDDQKYNKLNRPVHEVRAATSLVQHLRPHQREGVRFLYDCLMGFQESNFNGAILADEMGLGKTLQCLTVAHTLLRSGPYGGESILQRVLIVTPSSLTATWNNEINKWLKNERMYAFVVNGKHKLQQYSHQKHIPFVIVSYETFLANAEDFQQLEFDLLICDEGHRLKNKDTKVGSALRDMNIPRRVIVTGTPVQNDLQEFFTLADFVNPGVFGLYAEFRNYFENPIVQSQCPEANAEVLELAALRSAELNKISAKFLLRRTQDINQKYLPKKREHIVFVKPSELQQFMLQKVVEIYKNRKENISQDLTPLQIITILKKICNHPSLIARTKTPNFLTRYLERHLPTWSDMGPFDSAKLELVQNFLICTAVDKSEKVVIVSNHTKTLDMLQGLCDYLNLKSLRLDGSTPSTDRNSIVNKFNTVCAGEKSEELVFLLSAKAGGIGLNLHGASRLILFDNDWNPATDAQAMSRIWRDGQLENVQIYRLITAGTIEEKIFQRQASKISLGGFLFQSNQVDFMKFSADDLLDLFTQQDDFSTCQTHQSLNCPCRGDGLNLGELDNVTSGKQINELMQWEHRAQPFQDEFLESACLLNSADGIVYIFSHETDLK